VKVEAACHKFEGFTWRRKMALECQWSGSCSVLVFQA
jgi:hypothetical protein